MLDLASVTSERRAVVLGDIEIGSQPTLTYYILLGISELIAAFALIIGSAATLIGANVVAPLMTPIIGISLGLMRGDLRLLRTALVAEFGGALFAVAIVYLLGLLPFWGDPTPLLLEQTQPTLIELLVVLAIIGTLLSLAVPRYYDSVKRAEEATLKQNLALMRDAIDKYFADTGRYPSALDDLVARRYLRAIPLDPVTGAADTWVTVPPPGSEAGRVYDVKSGSSGLGRDGSPISTW